MTALRDRRAGDRSARTVLLVLSAACLASLPPAVAGAHPFHASIAEMEFNTARRRLEVALCVHPLDLERALREVSGEPVDLDRSSDIDRRLAGYLREMFLIRAGEDEACEVRWVGKEITLKEAWLYFEVPVPDAARTLTISNRVFFELQADQLNMLNVRVGEQRRALRCTRAAPDVAIDLPSPDSPSREPQS